MVYEDYIQLMHIKAAAVGTPLCGTFELTPRCTLNCRMCYIHSAENDKNALTAEKNTDWWLALAARVRERGNLTLLLTGGEPMLREDFDEIYAECSKAGQLVNVNTNATLITDKRKDMFTKIRPQRLNISVYGASAEAYERLCGNAGMYEVVKNNITDLVKAGVPVRVNFSDTPFNRDDMERVYEFASGLGVPMAAVSYIYPPARACGACVFTRFTEAEAARRKLMFRRMSLGDVYLKARYDTLKKGGRLESSGGDECDGSSGERIKCRAGQTTFWVTYDGRLTPCGLMNVPSYTLGDFDEGWKYIREARRNIILPAKCADCGIRDVCDTCAAVSYAETGKFDGLPEYMCRMTEEYVKVLDETYGKQP